jgi:hypothetical protein
MVLLAFTTLAFLVALVETEGRQVRAALSRRAQGMIWLMLPFAAVGLGRRSRPLFAYAARSFFWAQRRSMPHAKGSGLARLNPAV